MTLANRWSFAMASLSIGAMADPSALARTLPVAMWAPCGGVAIGEKLDGGADDLMWAESPRWREMGAGKYGPMRAMMFGYLNFEGPKMEAMGNMGPFAGFLLLVGKVPGPWDTCS